MYVPTQRAFSRALARRVPDPPPLPHHFTPQPSSRCSWGAIAAAFLASSIYVYVAWRALEVVLALHATPVVGIASRGGDILEAAGAGLVVPLAPSPLGAPPSVPQQPSAVRWGDPPGLALAGSLPGETFLLRHYARNDSTRTERLCKGPACSEASFFIVDMQHAASDSILDYLVRVEGRVQEMFAAILTTSDGCSGALYKGLTPWCRSRSSSGGAPPLVIDVGSNAGFYSLLSASFGAQVLAIDPQPHCSQFVRVGAAASGFGANVRVVNAFASAVPSANMASLRVRSGCWGTFPIIGDPEAARTAAHYNALLGGSAEVTVPGLPLSGLIRTAIAEAGGDADEGVILLKMDTEGFEADLVEHLEAEGVLRDHLVKSYVIELNKLAVLRRPESECGKDVPACYAKLIQRFQRAGYTLLVHEPFASLPIDDAVVFAAGEWRWCDAWFVLPR